MTDAIVKRDEKGRLLPGTSLNPGGRAKRVKELTEMARREVPAAIEFAARLIADETADVRVRLEAAKFVAAYGLGSPRRLDESDEADGIAERFRSMTDEQLEAVLREEVAQRNAMRQQAQVVDEDE